jgi:hypothetical protein
VRRALGVFLLLTAWSSGALAQVAAEEKAATQKGAVSPRVTEDAERARDLGRAGLDAYGQGDFARALDLFQKAEALAHSPVFQLYAARSLRELGKLDEARAEFETILATTPSEGAPEAWLRARSSAEDELAALPSPTSENPETTSQDFDADGHVVSVATAEMPPPDSHPEPAPRQSFWKRATPAKRGAMVAFGVGALGLVFAAVTGGIAMAESAAIKDRCMNNVCPPEELPRVEYATQMANLATVGAGVALAGGVTGAVLWFLPERDRGIALSVAGPSLRIEGRF